MISKYLELINANIKGKKRVICEKNLSAILKAKLENVHSIQELDETIVNLYKTNIRSANDSMYIGNLFYGLYNPNNTSAASLDSKKDYLLNEFYKYFLTK